MWGNQTGMPHGNTVMPLLVTLLPAAIWAQQVQKSDDPNDAPFLPIYPQYPYNPKLIKRGLEQAQQTPQSPQQTQQISQLSAAELYSPKLDSRDSYTTSYSANPYQSAYDSYSKPSTLTSQSSLTSSPYLQSSALSAYSSASPYTSASPYSLLSSFGSPFGNSPLTPYSANIPGLAPPPYAPGPYAPGASPAGPYNPGASPVGPYASNLFQNPYYYPNYYNQPPYPPHPYGYPGPYKHPRDYDDDDEDDKRRGKPKKSSQKNRGRDSEGQFVDGANYIISSSKDLDGESSTHRTPSHLNQIDDSDVPQRAVVIPKATYRLVSVSGGNQQNDNQGNRDGYIKIQQLEQLMRQALAKLLAQNAAQQANLAAIQQGAGQQDGQQYVAVPSSIAKTGLSYVVNPSILNRVNAGQYSSSSLIQNQGILNSGKQTYGSKPISTVTLQQSPGIYIPPSIKTSSDQTSSSDYGDYDSSEGATPKSQTSIGSYSATAEPTQTRSSYAYSTYRPTQKTSLEDVNFGSKQKSKS
ncbi:hypothetical protein QAD02_008683 [Eretmocerus hayati]|uniref:Uncharacterized protein n=1 Tax=Eretmocerus hayati TaxID=131215 RepID=A0ACC2N7Z9_9HYME|nr:hypothetical protein QAD02_008683 [Eretmocerus hayati]